ncbi:MAG TPA: TrkA C-terminal domain-containing protein [Alphaproteobacteria bacterium]|nr:TrkA C-terminal domain-containing protein [Alphaproteobacteria bacterium]
MDWAVGVLRHYPELAVFLVLGLGAWVGGVKLGGVNLGTPTGALFVGLVVGQLEIPVSGTAKSVLFMLFLVGNGYSIGPQFFRSLRGDGLRFLALAVFQATVGLAISIVVASALGLDVGLSAGLLSGALTQSPAIGTASEAIMALPLPEAERERLVGHVAIGDALCYVFGTFGTIWFLSRFAPRLLKIDLAVESRALEEELGVTRDRVGLLSGYQAFALRAHRLDDVELAGKTIADVEARFAGQRLYIARVRRGAEIIDAAPDTLLAAGDVLSLGGRRAVVMECGAQIGAEVDDRELLDMPITVLTVIAAHGDYVGRTLGELAVRHEARGVFLRKLTRLGQKIPILPGTEVQRGDRLELIGPATSVERVAARIGRADRGGIGSDVMALGLAVVIGGFIGAPYFLAGEFRIGLGTSVGALLAGIILGWIHSHRPSFGRVPEAASALMISLGLAGFVGMTGMQAGPHFLDAIQDSGLSLLLGGVVVTLVPLASALYFGRRVLRLRPILLLGACAGAQTQTPALAAIQDSADSRIAVLGYTVPYAIGQILLTAWGSVIVGVLR